MTTRCDCHGGRVFGDLLYGDTTTTICEKCNGTGFLPDADNQLFRDRTPQAAAQQLATVLAWATECQLATLEHIKILDARAKSEVARYQILSGHAKLELARHQDIADILVKHCHELGVNPVGPRDERCARLAKQLFAMGDAVDDRK